jgi:diguanylate cyclase (GGDEF)-like protein
MTRRHPPEINVLIVMTVLATFACAVPFCFPSLSQSPHLLNGGFALIGIAMATALWTARRVPRVVLHLFVLVWIGGMTTAVVLGATPQAATGTAITYTWTLVYTTYFFSATQARAYAVVSTLACLAALLAKPFPGYGMVWMLVTVTSLGGCETMILLLRRLRDAATLDQLTGQLNRTALVSRGPEELDACRRRGKPLCVAILDLDHFKQVNDLHGHAAGDDLLSSVARQWRSQLRDTDVLFRSGGDEFVLVLPDTTVEHAIQLLTRLREASTTEWCFGVAALHEDDDLDRALARADGELYAAKARRHRHADHVDLPHPRTAFVDPRRADVPRGVAAP